MTERSQLQKRVELLATAGIIAVATAMSLAPRAIAQVAFQGSPTTVSGDAMVFRGGPSGGQIAIDTVVINDTAAIINWDTFDRTTNMTIDFLPQNTTGNFTFIYPNATVLNRIYAATPDQAISFNGTIAAQDANNGPTNGSIWFYTPGGLILGPTARFNVGNLVLTTDDIVTTGGLFGPGGQIRFAGSTTSGAPVTVQPGAQITQSLAGSYLAVVAPVVNQGGIVSVNGSIGYIAAQQANVTINAGLFDITFIVGAPGGTAITHTGTTTGPAQTSGGSITFAAVGKNTAISMLLSGGIGYTPAATATVQNGQVVLLGGYATPFSAPVNATAADITITNAGFTSDVTAHSNANLLAAPTTFLNFSANASLSGDVSSTVRARDGARVFVNGDLRIDSHSPDFATGGVAALIADTTTGTRSLISVSGATTLDTSGFGVFNATIPGGNGVGGSSTIVVDASTLLLTGATSLYAKGEGGGSQVQGGSGLGGTASFTVRNAATLPLGLTAGNVLVSATGVGGGPEGSQTVFTGGAGTGGSALFTVQSARVQATDVVLLAGGTGSGGLGNGIGGSASAGRARFSLIGGAASLRSINADAAEQYGVSGTGGTTGTDAGTGNASVGVSSGALTVAQLLNIDASASYLPGQNPTSVRAATGGTALLQVTNGGSITALGGLARVRATALTAPGTGASAPGVATGGSATTTVGAASTLTTAGLIVDASARGSTGLGASGAGGNAVGGTAIVATGGTLALGTASLGIDARGIADFAATAANGTGGTAQFTATGGTATIGDLTANATGYGGLTRTGGPAGTGTGGTTGLTMTGATTQLSPASITLNADGASAGELITDFGPGNGGRGIGGSVTVTLSGGTLALPSGSVFLASADGRGGTTYSNAAFPGSVAGAGIGGTVNFGLTGAKATLATLSLRARGLGGGDRNVRSGFATAGGAATGGTVSATGSSGTLTTGAFTLDAGATGGNGGDGTDADSAAGGVANGGNATLSATGAKFDVASLSISTRGIGGAGGAARFTSPNSVSYRSGSGGMASAGTASASIASGQVAIGNVKLDATALGGVGGFAESSAPTATGKRGGNGGTASAGQAILGFGDTPLPGPAITGFNAIAILSGATGGDGGAAEIGGNGGNAAAGASRLTVADTLLTPPSLTITTAAQGGNGGVSARGAGASGGTAQGGNLLISATRGTLDLRGFSLLTLGAPGTGGAGSNGAAGTVGGNGGNGSGGQVALTASDNGVLRATDLALTVDGKGGPAGTGVMPGAASTGTGGAVSLSAAGATIVAGNLTADSTGTASIGGAGSGGSVLIETRVGSNGTTPGSMTLGAVAATVDAFSGTVRGGSFGSISLRDTGPTNALQAMRFASLNASAGPATPTNTTGTIGVTIDNPIVVGGAATLTASGRITVAAQGAGSLTAGTALTIAAGEDFVGSHAAPTMGGGAPSFVTLKGNGVTLSATGSVDAAGTSILSDAGLTATATTGFAALGWLDGVDALTVSAGTNITIDRATTLRGTGAGQGMLTVAAPGRVQIATASAGRDLVVNAGGPGLSVASGSAARDVKYTTSGGGNIVGGSAAAGDDIIISGAGAVTLDSGTTTRNFAGVPDIDSSIFITSTGATIVRTLTAFDNVVIGAASLLATGNVTAGGSIAATTSAATSLASATAGTTLTVDAGSTIGFTSLNSGAAATFRAATGIAGGSATSGASLLLDTTSGTIGFGDLVAATSASITAPGTVTGASVRATAGPLTISGGTGITVPTLVSGGLTSLTAINGAIGFTSLSSTGAASVRAGTGITGGSATGGSSLLLDTTSGTIGFGDLVAATSASITAPGAITGTSVRATAGPLTISGGTGITVPTVVSGGFTTLTATNGAITVATNVQSAGKVSASGRSIFLRAPGSLSTGIVSVTAGDADIQSAGALSADDTQASGNITLASTGANGAIVFGTAVAGIGASITTPGIISGNSVRATTGPLVISGGTGFSIGSLVSGGVTDLTATNGTIDIGSNLQSAGKVSARARSVTLRALGSLATGIVVATAGDADIQSGGALTADDTQANGTVTLASTGANGSVGFGNVVAGASASITASATVTGTSARATGGALTISGASGIAIPTLFSGTTTTLTATNGAIGFTSLSSTGAASVRAGTGIAGGSATGGSSLLLDTTSGTIGFGDLVAATSASITAPGTVTGASVRATAGPLTISGGTGITVPTLVSGGLTSLTAINGAIGFTSLSSTGAASVRAGTGITGGSATGGSSLLLDTTSGTIGFGDLVAATSASITAPGAITGTSVRATAGPLTISGASGITVPTVVSGGFTTLTATNGAITVATNVQSAGKVSATGRSIFLRAPGSLSTGIVSVTAGDADIQSAGALSADDTQASGNITLASTGGAVTVGTAITPRDLAIRSNGLATINGLATGVTVNVRSADIAIGATASVGQAATTTQVGFTNISSAVTTIGGNSATTGYALSNAEMQRVFARNIAVTVPSQTGAAAGTQAPASITPNKAPDVILDTLTLNGGAAGNLNGGTLRLQTPGKLRVVGTVTLNNLTSANRFEIVAADAIEALPASSITLNGTTGLTGTLALTSADIIATSPAALADIAAATNLGGSSDRIGKNDSPPASDTGYFAAGGVIATVGSSIYVQNSGAAVTTANRDFAGRRGFTVGDGGFMIVQANATPIRVAINGRQVASASPTGIPVSGFVTGIDLIPAIIFVPFAANGQAGTPVRFTASNLAGAGTALAASIFDPLSTVNGCRIVASTACNGGLDTGNIARDTIEHALEQSQTATQLLPVALVQLRDFTGFIDQPLVDEPVTGSGNDDLYAIDDARTCDPASGTVCPQ